MILIKWTGAARTDLDDILFYFAAKSEKKTGKKIVDTLFKAPDPLVHSPFMGRSGRISGTRELVLQRLPYIIVYRLRNNIVEILRVIHTSRAWPKSISNT